MVLKTETNKLIICQQYELSQILLKTEKLYDVGYLNYNFI